jgi:RimJ/RimL family protein N-acetyltransferase
MPPQSQGRLRLRTFTNTDRYTLVKMHQEPRVRELLMDDVALDNHNMAALFLERIQTFYTTHPGMGIWAAEHWYPSLTRGHPDFADAARSFSPEALERALQPKPHFVGWFNLMPIPHQPEEVEMGCRLLPHVWGSGLAMEGGAMMLEHAFGPMGRTQVWAVCHPEHRSVHLRLRMLGFEFDGERLYDDVSCSHFVVQASTWTTQRTRPLALRQREALAWVKLHSTGAH